MGAPGASGKKSDIKVENKISSHSDAGMSDADVKCYESRFSDLDGRGGREHYLEIG